MSKMHRLFSLLLPLALLAPGGAVQLLGCSGGTEPVSGFAYHPDLPFKTYAGGELGVLRQTYARSYLVVAYRELNGRTFSASEQQALSDYWMLRSGIDRHEVRRPAGLEAWQAALTRISPNEKPENDYYSFNCYDDAFLASARRADALCAKFGCDSPLVKDWVHAQKQVFASCYRSADLPEPATASLPEELQKDRAYQIASARFYRKEYDEAVAAFDAIAADGHSSWRIIAPYLAARTLIRKAWLHSEDQPSLPEFQAARARLEKVLADSSRAALHVPARKLLSYVVLRLDPEGSGQLLAAKLFQDGDHPDLVRELGEYTWYLDWVIGGNRGRDASPRITAAAAKNDMNDWLLTFQNPSAASADHAYERWLQTGSRAWLVAALYLIHSDDQRLTALLESARLGKPGTPGYLSISFARISHFMKQGRLQAARALLSEVRIQYSAHPMPPGSANEFRVAAAALSVNLQEFAENAAVAIVGSVGDWEENEENPQPGPLSDYAEALLNEKIPLSKLAAMQPFLTPGGFELARIIRNRALLLDRPELVRNSNPPDPVATQFLSAASLQKRRFSAVYMLLKSENNISLRLSGGMVGALPWDYEYQDSSRRGLALPSVTPSWLTPELLAEAEAEQRKLKALGASATLYCRESFTWAKAHPDDPRNPEALSLALHATKYSEHDDDTKKYCSAAIAFLHNRYPGNPWSKSTKYWY